MTQSDFLSSIWPSVLQASQSTGIDPRIIAAQAALESNYGKSAPGGNLFGIKGGNGPALATTEVINGQPVQTRAQFRQYSSPEASVAGYADFINSNPRYQPFRQAQGLDAQLAALGKSGYATDPNYAAKVGAIAKGIQASAMPTQAANSAPALSPPQTIQNHPVAASAPAPVPPAAAAAAKSVPQGILSALKPASTQQGILGALLSMGQQQQPPQIQPMRSAGNVPSLSEYIQQYLQSRMV